MIWSDLFGYGLIAMLFCTGLGMCALAEWLDERKKRGER